MLYMSLSESDFDIDEVTSTDGGVLTQTRLLLGREYMKQIKALLEDAPEFVPSKFKESDVYRKRGEAQKHRLEVYRKMYEIYKQKQPEEAA